MRPGAGPAVAALVPVLVPAVQVTRGVRPRRAAAIRLLLHEVAIRRLDKS